MAKKNISQDNRRPLARSVSLSLPRLLTVMVLVCLAALSPCRAQNRIDRLVDDYSTLGSSKFTSVVERDPQTRRVLKVVKRLQLPGHQAESFRQAFLKEQDSGSFSRQQTDDEQTMTLTCETAAALRIYMLQMQGQRVYHSATVTIIVKPKEQ